MGPIPDPWIILVFIAAVGETLPSHLTTGVRPVKYEMVHHPIDSSVWEP